MPERDAPPSASAHRLRGLLLNLTLSLVVAAAFAAALEGLARWTEKPLPAQPLADTHGLDWQMEWQGDFYLMKSDSVGWPPTQDFNHDGVRDRPHPREKPPRTYRVAGLGDSVTLGYGFPRAEAWPQALQQLADARGPGVEVFNVAEVGWSTRQERYAYERVLRPYHPDVVVLAYVLNDLEDLENNLSQPPRLLVELFKRSALVRRLTNAEGREIKSVEELFRQPETAKVTSGYRRLFEEVRKLADEVREDGARFVVLICPDADQVGAEAPPPVPQERMAAFLRAQGMAGIDVLPVLRPIGPAGFMDRIHFTPAGSKRVAQAVLESTAVPASAYTTASLRAALSDRGEPEEPLQASLAGLVAAARAATPAVRRQAVWALGRRGMAAPEVVEALAAALDDPDRSVRGEAERALALLGPAARQVPGAGALAQQRLIAMLGDAGQEIRWSAADALSQRGEAAPQDVPWLVEALRSPDPYVRGFAVWNLDLVGRAAEGAVPALETCLHDPEPGIRTLAVRALGNVGRHDSSAVASLAEVIAHGAGDGRWRAARALGKLGPAATPAVGALAVALSDPDEKLRTESARALERIGPSAGAAVTALVAAQHDSSETVREAAQSAIRTITASR